MTPGWGRVQAICDFVHSHIKFDYQAGALDPHRLRGFQERVGVCRDFAHLAVAFCRCLNIPARYVNGHLGDIGVPVARPDGFFRLDRGVSGRRVAHLRSAQQFPRIGRIVVARGRDAADIPLINSFGPHILKSFRVWTYEVDSVQTA